MVDDIPMEQTEQTAAPESTAIEQENLQREVQSTQAQESSQQKNFRMLRMEKERIERERDEAFRRLQEYEAAKHQKTVPDDDFQMDPDAIVEGKHFKKMHDYNKQLKAEIDALKARTASETAEARIQTRFPDFYSVVTQDNIDSLRSVDPELADTLSEGTDLYKKAVATYKAIKNMQPNQSYDADKKKAQENAAKPRPLTSVSPQQGDSPLSHANAFANGLTEDLRKQLWKEMETYRKNL